MVGTDRNPVSQSARAVPCDCPPPRWSPWGLPEKIEAVAPGIWFVSTPSHGGYYLDRPRNHAVPLTVRSLTFQGLGFSGWYEEDRDAAIVPAVHTEAFDPDKVTEAIRALRLSRHPAVPLLIGSGFLGEG